MANLAVLALLPILVGARGLAENQVVPELRAPDLQGTVRTLSDFPGRITLLLFWQPDNERSRQALCAIADLEGAYEKGGLATVVSGPHDKAEIENALQSCRNKPPVLLDPDRKVFGAFEIIALPTLMLVGSDRRLKYKLAGFGREGVGQLEARLDAVYGREKTASAAAQPASSPEALRRFGLAGQLLKVGMEGQAESILTALTREHPEFRPAWVALGYRKIAAALADEARECFENASRLDSKPSDIAAGMAWVWWKKGDAAQSAKWAAAVQENDPNYGLVKEIRK